MQDLWKQLADELNACRGPTRTAAKWKETLGVWKCHLRMRARRWGPSSKPLSDFEEKALTTFGSAAVDGVEAVGTFGLMAQVQMCSTSSAPSTAALPSPPTTTPTLLPSPNPITTPSPLPSPNPTATPSPLPSPNSPWFTSESSPYSSNMNLEYESDSGNATASRLSRGERNKLMKSLIANISKRNANEEARKRREQALHRELQTTLQAVEGLTNTVAELIKILKEKNQ